VLDIDRRTGPVVLAHRLDGAGIVEHAPVGGEHRRRVAVRVLPQAELASHVEVEEGVGVAGDQPLGQRGRERQERPVPVAARDAGGRPCPDVPSGDDVEHGQPLHALGVIERHPVRDTAAAVVAGHREGRKAEPLHHLHLIERHRALAVRGVVGCGCGPEGGAVAGQVGRDDGVVLGEQRGGRVPHERRLRVAVQQQQRRAASSDQRVDRPAGRVQLAVLEAGEDARSAVMQQWRHATPPS
jgi:hypothetical protein